YKEVLDQTEAEGVCWEMMRILQGVTLADLHEFSMAVFMLSKKGYETGNYSQIARDLVDIIRLRGLFNKELRWKPTVELVWKLWMGENGLISPRTIREFLVSAGPEAAKALSDDGLINMMIYFVVEQKNGD